MTSKPSPIDAELAKRLVNAVKDIPNWRSSHYFDKRWQWSRIKIRFDMRRNDGFMGRFGGGWDWKLGIQASTPNKYGWTVIISLLVASLSIDYAPGKEPK